jgi:hypothetical protein
VLWLAHYQRSANTRAADARELLPFLGWLRAQRIDAFAVRGAHVERCVRRLQRAVRYEPNRMMSDLRMWWPALRCRTRARQTLCARCARCGPGFTPPRSIAARCSARCAAATPSANGACRTKSVALIVKKRAQAAGIAPEQVSRRLTHSSGHRVASCSV